MKSGIFEAGLAVLVALLLAGTAFGGYHSKEKTGYNHKIDKMKMDFKSIDADSNGSLSFKEYQTAFPTSSRKAFDYLDTDKNGTLNADEWQIFKDAHTGMGGYHKKAHHGKKMPDPGEYNAHFGDMDTDGDQQVTMMEFETFFPNGKHKAKVFDSIDMDRSDTIDHEEWHQFKEAHDLKHQD